MQRHLALLTALAACSGHPDVGDDQTPPVLEIDAPERGTTTSVTSIEIRGRAIDDGSGIAEVSVNGVAAKVDGDGGFALTLNTVDGITLLETIAVDAAGNQARDARAVLAGNVVLIAEPVVAGLVGRLSAQAMGGLGEIIGQVANGIDWTALVTGFNPVANSGGTSCNSYSANVESVEHGGFVVDTTAIDGGIGGAVRVTDLVVRGRINFRAVCVSGSTSFTVTADAFDIGAAIVPTLADQAIEVDLEDVTSGFTNFNVNAGGVPGFVEDHFEPQIRDTVAQVLRDQASELVPGLATDFLADFLGTSHSLELLGRSIDLAVWPTAMAWTESGGTITLDGSTQVPGAESAVYLSSPRPAPMASLLPATGLAVGVADDTLNQLLAGMWATGAFTDTSVPIGGDTLDAVFGVEGTEATITMLLPPVASFDGESGGPTRLVIGDLMVDAVDPSGELLASVVVSAEIELTARAGGMGLALSTATPRILAQVLETSPNLIAPIDDAKVAAIAGLAIGQLAGAADDLLTGVPIPGINGASIDATVLASTGGYLVVGGELGFD